MSWLAFGAGLVLGLWLGMAVICALVASARADEAEERALRTLERRRCSDLTRP